MYICCVYLPKMCYETISGLFITMQNIQHFR